MILFAWTSIVLFIIKLTRLLCIIVLITKVEKISIRASKFVPILFVKKIGIAFYGLFLLLRAPF